MEKPILREIIEQVKILPDNMQYKVLSIIKDLRTQTQQGIPGIILLQFSGSIPAQDIDKIRETIQSGCEQIDINEW